MPKNTEPAPRRGRILLDGLQEGQERPRLAIHALDDAGNVIKSVSVEEDGSFPMPSTCRRSQALGC
jgi:hypothetical protein